MYRIGVITSDIEKDWASQQLLTAASSIAEGVLVNPISFGMRTDPRLPITVEGGSADDIDAFIMRGFNRDGEIDYQNEIVELLEMRGKIVINSPASLSIAESKAQTTYCLLNAGLPSPRTVVTQKLDEALEGLKSFGSAVVKPLYGSHGVGIEKVDAADGVDFLREFHSRYGAIYIQEFIPNAGRDIRAFVVGDEVPAAMYRVATDGNWKTNIFQGSSSEPCELKPEVRTMCIEAARVVGLDYTGVDVMEGPDGPAILEVNGAPSWWGLSEVTDHNIAADVVRHLVSLLRAGKSARQPVTTVLRCSA